MKQLLGILPVLIFLAGGLAGCSHSAPLLPVHKEVLVYPLPFDLVYLRTLEAMDLHPDWEPSYTVKEKGLIYLRNVRYSSFADADRRDVTVVVKRIGRRETSVQLASESQAVAGAGELLTLVKENLSREAALR